MKVEYKVVLLKRKVVLQDLPSINGIIPLKAFIRRASAQFYFKALHKKKGAALAHKLRPGEFLLIFVVDAPWNLNI